VLVLAVPRPSRAAGARPLLPASVAVVVHTAEVAEVAGTWVVRFVALVSSGGHYVEDLRLCLLAVAVSAGASEQERCFGDDEQVLELEAEMQRFLASGAGAQCARTQERHAVSVGADVAAAGGSVDNSVIVGSAARLTHPLLRDAGSAWRGLL
jgi:hypothetical protein